MRGISLYGAVSALIVSLGCLMSCDKPIDYAADTGVGRSLAEHRKATISDLSYKLHYDIPEQLSENVAGNVQISFILSDNSQDLVLDFRPGQPALFYAEANGKTIFKTGLGHGNSAELCRNEHIVVPRRFLAKGANTLSFSFEPENGSLNRHEEYLYTLLVPERARTVFPCFDQPDLKARFTLSLEIPAHWSVVANGELKEEKATSANRKSLQFKESDLLSTYLFEFTAGLWESYTFKRGDRPMTIWYRENDPAKVAQLPQIRDQILFSLDYMEEYTGIPMPFSKYDSVIVPGFQFGGMEHPGAILYSAARMFLSENPSEASRLSRIDLIAHETAHLWFGDAVTMEWFDDVWTKEVFANYFAAQISRPLFPDTDYQLKDFSKFNLTAYSEDRTAGTTPICQTLDNLEDSGLIYSNIIYDKAPVVMRMLSEILGPEAFQAGLREYLRQFMYGNATWDALIAILDKYTDTDLIKWSYDWTKVAGMPEYPADADKPLPNLEGSGYGFFQMSRNGIAYALEHLPTLERPVERLSTLTNLYENYLHGNVEPASYADCLSEVLKVEKDQIVAAKAISDLASLGLRGSLSGTTLVEDILAALASDNRIPNQIRLSAFRQLRGLCRKENTINELYAAWESAGTYHGLPLSTDDYTILSYELALRLPDRYDHIRTVQRARLSGKDKIDEFDYKYRSVHPSPGYRDSLFESFLVPENRLMEPWTSTCLSYLNHPLRQSEALKYIRPALRAMPDIQRTGDIFFPKNWISAVLRGHSSAGAAEVLKSFLEENKDLKPLLRNKILQAGDHLLRELP